MYIKCNNLNKHNIICRVDNKPVFFKNDANGNAYAYLELEKGKHSISIKKLSWYDTPFCYLNILNPLFYIWQLKFLEHRLPIDKKSFVSLEMDFEISDKKEQIAIFSLCSNKESKTYSFNCDKFEGIENISIKKQNKHSLLKKRYKITHICSSVLYMIILNALAVINCIQGGGILQNVLFCILITVFSLFNIYRIKDDK